MPLAPSVNHPISCGSLSASPGWVFDKGRAAEFVVQATPQQRVVQAASTSSVVVKDANYTRASQATIITDFRVSVAYSDPGASFPVTLTSSNTAILADPSNGIAPGVSGGVARITGSASGRQSVVRDVNVAQTSGSKDTFTSFVSGSVGESASTAIDSRTSSGTKPMYSTADHANGTYVRNANCWAASLDMTCISPWSNYGGDGMTGTLISPRHVLFANHYRPTAGTVMRWVDSSNNVVSRTLSAISQVGSTDIAIGLLASDVPSSINFARILPQNWRSYIPAFASGATTIPVLTTRTSKPALVSDLFFMDGYFKLTTPSVAARRALKENIVAGDSGNPVFLVIANQLVVIGTYYFGGDGSGPVIHDAKSNVNAVMASLGGGYSLTEISLSGFPSY